MAELDPDSLFDVSMDELLSYLFLTRDDFMFRDDYTEKDRYRLAVVDDLMKHPLLMREFADSCRKILESFEECPDCVMEFLSKQRQPSGVAPDASNLQLIDGKAPWPGSKSNFRKIHKNLRPLIINAADWLNLYTWASFDDEFIKINEPFSDQITQDKINLIRHKYKEVILEDENFKEQTAEEMDSIQHLEEGYIVEFAEVAEGFSDIEFVDITSFMELIDSAGKIFATNKKIRKGSKPGKPLFEIKTDYGLISIGSYGDDIYRGDYFMIFDPGGNDSYYISYDIANPHPTLIVDYGGNDFYKAESEFALASGAFSYSFLIDYAGDDIYHGGNFSLGAGYFGVGILWDKRGNDGYFGDTFTQGAGTFGLGLLIDSDGSDNYTGNLSCQGFGFVRGLGGIVDRSGNDTYSVQGKYPESFHGGSHFSSLSQGFAVGARPHLSGGFGFLYDLGGNDSYVADYFCQGASYWWSLGILYDDAGDDKYLSHQYAQGNGTHMALGYLRDNSGNDVYCSHSVSQGCGHDYACGWLMDKRGDDIYSGHDLVQGAGQANGIGIFTDILGQDGYYVFLDLNTQGYGNPRQDYGSIGVFLDCDGSDRYDGNGSNNRFWITDSKWGGGLDRQIDRPNSSEGG